LLEFTSKSKQTLKIGGTYCYRRCRPLVHREPPSAGMWKFVP